MPPTRANSDAKIAANNGCGKTWKDRLNMKRTKCSQQQHTDATSRAASSTDIPIVIPPIAAPRRRRTGKTTVPLPFLDQKGPQPDSSRIRNPLSVWHLTLFSGLGRFCRQGRRCALEKRKCRMVACWFTPCQLLPCRDELAAIQSAPARTSAKKVGMLS